MTWRSEAPFPAAFDSTAVYGATRTARPPHRAAGVLWLAFLKLREAFAIRHDGFEAVPTV